MEAYKKEKSSRHHMKIDIHSNGAPSQDGLLLANPMAYDNTSPGGNNGTTHKQVTSPSKQDVHFSLLNSISPPAVTDPQHGNPISHSHTNSLEFSNTFSGTLARGTSSERSSFRDKSSKSRPKSPSLFRFFVKGHSNGGSANGSLTSSPMTGASGRRSTKRYFCCCVYNK